MTSFQKLLGISFLIIALSFAYYLVIYVPNREKTKQLLENQNRNQLNNCLVVANQLRVNEWNSLCNSLGREQNCLLSQPQADGIRKDSEQVINGCYKLYSP